MESSILTLARAVRERPNDQTAVAAFTEALRSKGEMSTVAALIECWAVACEDAQEPELAVAALYCRLADSCNAKQARRLSQKALDLAPTSHEALMLFERYSEESDQQELCDRYAVFLARAPLHPSAPRIRARLIDRLVDAGRRDEALEHSKLIPTTMSPRAVPRQVREVPRELREVREVEVEWPARHTRPLPIPGRAATGTR